MRNRNTIWYLVLGTLSVSTVFLMSDPTTTKGQSLPPKPKSEVRGIQIDSLANQPITPLMKELAKKEISEMAAKGYINATEDEVLDLEKYQPEKEHIRPIKEVGGKLKSKMANLGIAFKTLKLNGAIAHGVNVDGLWTMVTRFFAAPDGTTLTLEEWDYNASGGGVIMTREWINESVGSHPANLVIKESPSGKAVTTLEWYTERKGYTLTTSENVKKKGSLQRLLALAASIED